MAVDNGTVLYSELIPEHSSKLEIECEEGFYLSQDQDMVCDGGQWVSGSVSCKRTHQTS